MIIRIVFLSAVILLLATGSGILLRHGSGRWRLTLITFAAALVLSGLGMMLTAAAIFPVLTETPAASVLYALPWALGFGIIGAFLSVPVQRLTNPLGTINPLLPCAMLTLGLAAGAMLGAGWHRLSNGWCDSAPVAQRAEIMETRDNTIIVRWDNGTVDCLASTALNKPQLGDKVEMQVGKGYQGMMWLADWKTMPEQ